MVVDAVAYSYLQLIPVLIRGKQANAVAYRTVTPERFV